jgi:integrase
MGDVKNRGTKNQPMWYCRYIDVDGKRKHRPTHQSTKALAMRYLAEVEARVARGLVGIPERDAPERQGPALTLTTITERFLAEAHPNARNPERYRSWFRYTMNKHVLPDLGMLCLPSIRLHQVEALRDRKLAEGYKSSTVNSMLKALSVVWRWAAKHSLTDAANPTAGLRKPPPTGLVDFLSNEEVSRLLAHAREHMPDLHPMIATAIYAGLRKGELFGLRWQDIAFDRSLIHVAHSYTSTPKSGKWRPVPLHPALAPLLRDWQRRCATSFPDVPLVFPVKPERGNYVRMGTADDMLDLEPLLKAAGCHVPVRPWHALRHTFASHYVMSGGNILALSKILGHSKLETTMIYAHLAPNFMAGEIARLSFDAPSAAKVIPRSQGKHVA